MLDEINEYFGTSGPRATLQNRVTVGCGIPLGSGPSHGKPSSVQQIRRRLPIWDRCTPPAHNGLGMWAR